MTSRQVMDAARRDAASRGEAMAAWTGERVLAAMRDWAREHGAPPRMRDWARADRGQWPPSSLVVRMFDGWSDAVAAAGLTPWRGGRQGPAWPEERIERELRAFVAGRDRLPRDAAFRAAGRGSLSDAVRRSGGPELWARRLGLALEPSRPESPSGWSDERLERELRALLADRTVFPSAGEFRQAGSAALYKAVGARGGVEEWAARLGVSTRDDPGDGLAFRRKLEAYVGERRTLPSQSELRQAGRRDLLNGLRRHGGAARWASELGLTVASAGRPQRIER